MHGGKHILNVYNSGEATPRPESYREDLELVEGLKDDGARHDLWRNIRAAAESGWDFSSRWMADGKTLQTTATSELVTASGSHRAQILTALAAQSPPTPRRRVCRRCPPV